VPSWRRSRRAMRAYDSDSLHLVFSSSDVAVPPSPTRTSPATRLIGSSARCSFLSAWGLCGSRAAISWTGDASSHDLQGSPVRQCAWGCRVAVRRWDRMTRQGPAAAEAPTLTCNNASLLPPEHDSNARSADGKFVGGLGVLGARVRRRWCLMALRATCWRARTAVCSLASGKKRSSVDGRTVTRRGMTLRVSSSA
jgi:hypothetical protein